MKEQLKTFGKGMCMGFSDVVPGVSGGTIALLLGIYERFINALKSLDFRWVKPLKNVFSCKFEKNKRTEFRESLKSMDFPWLCCLLLGLATAFLAGSFIIPSAMEHFPEIMWSFFFGLVLASASVPIRMIGKPGFKEIAVILVFLVGTFFLLSSRLECPATMETLSIADEGRTLQQITQMAPSALTPNEILQLPENNEINEAYKASIQVSGSDSANSANEFVPPAGSQLTVPVPSKIYIFAAGFIAICALVLPGISGSFVMLVLGTYYFMLNTLKTFLKGLASGHFLFDHFLYCLLFGTGIILGVVIFSRFLSWLLSKFRNITLSAILGIMLGCLRAIWPFRERQPDGTLVNALPPFNDVVFFWSICAALLGIAIVVFINVSSRKKNSLH